jgi:hypothetical protein
MEPLFGKRERESGPDTPDILRKADRAYGNDNRIPSAVRTAAPTLRMSPAAARRAQGLGLSSSTKVPFHFAVAAVIVSHAAVANGL